MKRDTKLLKITLLFTTFALGVGAISVHNNVTPSKVEAAQHVDNYNNYTYSGTYYNTLGSNLTDGMNGTLRTSLTTLTYPKAWYNYSNNLPDMLPDADQDPTNSNNMVLFYSRDSVSKNTSASWNKEHVWPQSKSNGHISTSAGAGSDLLHIRPTYNDTNSKRGSLMMGDVADSYAVYYSNMLYGYCVNNSKFEPIDAVKGDVARIFMYLWTAYRNQFSLNMLDVIESYNTLLTWHTLDKPDALEARRNQYAQDSNQKNRNPFVDHPEYAWRIFAVGNSSVSESVKNACMTAYPADGYTPGPNGGEGEETITVAKTTSISVGDTVILTTGSSYAKQFSGISTTSTKYGMTADYSGEAPDGESNQLEVVQGYNANTLAFKYNDNYLCWSSGNSLDVKNTIDANSSWTVSFSGENAVIANASNSSRTIRYNASSPRFACYESGQADVALWKVTSGGSVDPDPITPTGITLNTNSLSLEVGEEETLTATLSPNGATGNVIWSSGDESVATVEDGIVTAVGGGSTVISVGVEGVSGVSATCSVTVSEPAVVEEAIYNLKSCGETSSYTASSDITFGDGKIWNIPGNQTLSYGLKLGGRLSGATDRAMYSKSGYDNVSRIVVTHGGKDNVITVNSVKLYVYDSAEKAATGNVDAADETVIGTFVNNGVTTFEPDSGNPWQGKYFRIVYNLTSSDSTSNKGVVLTELKIEYSSQSNPETAEDYLSTASTYATLHGRESGETLASLNFAAQGYANSENLSGVVIDVDSNITTTCDKSTGGTTPAYFNSGTSLRLYGGNTLTIAAKAGSNAKITKVELTITSGSFSSLTVSSVTMTSNIWTGNTSSVEFKNKDSSGHLKITDIAVTYQIGSYSVDNVSIRFGASISQENWNAIENHQGWNISDYGVMMLKKSTLTGYGETKVADAYNHKKAVTTINIRKNGAAYVDPYVAAGTTVCSFTARISFSSKSDFNDLIVAAPFVVVDDHYYFLGNAELEFSVNTLATKYINEPNYHGGSSLSNRALTYLSTAH